VSDPNLKEEYGNATELTHTPPESPRAETDRVPIETLPEPTNEMTIRQGL
jgi:hypothetical protein